MSAWEKEVQRRTELWRRALEDCEPRHVGALRELRDTVRKRLRQDTGR